MKMDSMMKAIREATIAAYLPKAEEIVRTRYRGAADPAGAAKAALTMTRHWDALGQGTESDEAVLTKIIDLAEHVYPEFFLPAE